MKRSSYLIMVHFILLISVFSCKQEEKMIIGENESHPARYIKYTPEKIFPDEPISIEFISPMVKVEQIGKNIEKKIFEIKPDIDGEITWKGEKTLVFVPEKELDLRKEYKVKFKLKELSDEYKEYADLNFNFETIGREVSFYKGEFIEDSNKEAHYEADLNFNYKVDKNILKNEIRLSMNGNNLDLKLTGSDKQFHIKTGTITQTQDEKLFKLTVFSDNLQLSNNYELDFSFTRLHEMKVDQISRIIEEDNPAIIIDFTSELSRSQSIEGLINITPAEGLDLNLNKLGKKVTVTGKFDFGKEYTVELNENLVNSRGEKLGKSYSKKIMFQDKSPQISFTDKGCFLTSGNDKKIQFMTMNTKSVELVVKKVYESNLGQFLQSNNLSNNRSNDYYYYGNNDLNRVGIELKKKTLTIGERKNEWVNNEIDLDSILTKDEKGLYVIELQFNEKDILYKKGETYKSYDNRFPKLYGKSTKYIISSDIGLTLVKSEDEHKVIVFNLETTKPIQGAKVKLVDYQNQILSKGKTNKEGKAEFGKVERNVFYAEVEYNGQRSVIKVNEMKWNLSTFDVSGSEYITDKIRSFIYTERGVYRPGDEINISMIFRNKDNTFPQDHPVKIEIKNPQNKVVKTDVLKQGYDGFYSYKFKTDVTDMTGSWRFTADAGGKKFSKNIKVETVVPEKLKVEIKTDKEKITYSDTEIKVDLSSIYLFGSPASNLKAKVTYRFNSVEKTFKKYSNYTFSDELKNFSDSFKNLINSELDDNGKKEAVLSIPNLKDIPSALSLELKAEVLEKGGRPNKDSKQISYDPYKRYVGIERPERSYIKTGDTEMINTILLSSEGSPIIGQEMTVKIYYNNRYWWWDYNRRRNKLNFRNDYETDLVVEEKFISGKEPYKIKFNPKESGKYLIEVIQSMDKLHSASYFINSSYWGNSSKDINDAGLLALTTNKKTYKPGETAIVKFPTSPESRVIVSIDKGAKNLDFYGIESAGNETTLKIPITANMLPNIYCSISVIQPNSQRKNDRPIRSYGTISLNVEDKYTHSEIEIDVPEVIKPNEKFKVKLQTKDKKQTQFTLAVVDEGLLSITDFSTPDPWKYFYNKLRLGVNFFDNYDYVINSNKGDVLNTFSVGGGLESMSARKKMLSNVKANRFIPVSMFKGPMKTDKNGYAEVELKMSEYIGAVRIMAISADKEKFGSDEVSIPVRSELMVLPSIPRNLSPHDEFDLPVTIFSMEESIKNVKVTLKLEGPLTSEILTKEVVFNGKETKNISFRLTAKDQIGKAKIKITATAGKFKTESNTEIAVKPLSPRVFRSFTEKCSKGSEVKFELPKDVLQGTKNVSITVSKAKIPDVYRRINYLIGYPYGCLEQTTSKGFAQLAVKDLLIEYSRFNETIDGNINSTINRLRGFQFDNGSFSYWMNERDSYSEWSDIFSGHFLWEAKRKGYFVPVDLWKNWKRNMHSQALKARIEKISNWMGWNSDYEKRRKYMALRTQLYRLYVLAMIEEPEIGQMNIIKEMNLSYMDDTERWILAACYYYAGLTDIAQNIVSKTGILVKEYSEMSGTFGSELRDKGIILNCLTLMDKEGQATDLYNSIVDRLNSDEWMSTQTSAFAMLSVGKYMEKYKSYFSSEGKYSIAIKDIKFNSDKMSITKEIKNFSDNIIVSMGADSDLAAVYVTMNWDGIPQKPTEVREGKGLIIERTWYDDNGNQIKNTTSKNKLLNKLFSGSNKLTKALKQGQVFKMKIKVKKRTQAELKNMALMQIIPSGWEIENKRLDNANAYSSANSVRNYGYNSSYNYNRKQSINYVDIRDDRAMWFFDLDKNVKEIEFEIDLRCVSTGKFYMSPTIAESMYSREYYIIEPGFEVEVEK